MSRTHHLTRTEANNNSRPTRQRAKTRLTKPKGQWYLPNTDRPENDGNQWRVGFNAGQRRRKEQRDAKILGRRIERRRLNRSAP